jgi:hypothetical protein
MNPEALNLDAPGSVSARIQKRGEPQPKRIRLALRACGMISMHVLEQLAALRGSEPIQVELNG